MKWVFTHGLGQGPEAWDRIISCMGSDVSAKCPDLFRLPNTSHSSYDDLYRGFSAFCGQFPGPLCLCGLSLGGVLALNYCLDHPTRIQSLVLIATPFRMPKMMLHMQNILFRFMPNSTFQKLGMSRKDVILLTTSMMPLDFTARLQNVRCDTFVVCGEKDAANQQSSRELARRIDGAHYHVIPSAGHEVNKDAPEELASILTILNNKQQGV